MYMLRSDKELARFGIGPAGFRIGPARFGIPNRVARLGIAVETASLPPFVATHCSVPSPTPCSHALLALPLVSRLSLHSQPAWPPRHIHPDFFHFLVALLCPLPDSLSHFSFLAYLSLVLHPCAKPLPPNIEPCLSCANCLPRLISILCACLDLEWMPHHGLI